jgi:ubiquinone/menaquinone biosynthesis C-methylase UbiE
MNDAVKMKGGEHHDWHSAEYVDTWVAKDRNRDERRRPLLAQMMTFVPYRADQAIRVLDVGGGYGAVSAAVLEAFPNAKVTLQDYSDVMLERARRHFAAGNAPGPSPVNYVRSDLTDPSWPNTAGGPYDLVVSGIAIHNLGNADVMREVYRGVHSLLAAGGVFLDCDHFDHAGGVPLQLQLFADAGFEGAECLHMVGKTGIIRARRPA